MNEPFFTVMIPTRNRASMLPTALRSLLWQTCGDFECIVMDDGSVDGTQDVFKRFAGDPRFSWHRFAEKGVGFCRNFALSQARGRFVTFLDDDDIWLPTRLEKFRDAARARPGAGFWFSNAFIWRYDHVIGRVFDPAKSIPEGRVPGYYAIGERILPYVTTNMAVVREAFAKVGPFHEGIPILVDTDMCVRVLDAGFEVGVVREALAVRRMHDAQVTKDHAKAFDQSVVLFQNARATEEIKASLRRDLALDIALNMLKSLEPEKMREFLSRSGIPKDARYRRLDALGRLPRAALSLLYRTRKAYLERRHSPRFAKKEYREIDALVRPLL